jgi:hypothetical protein
MATTSPLMLYRDLTAVHCENHVNHINTLCAQTPRFLNVTADGTYSYHCALKDYENYAVAVTFSRYLTALARG